MIKVSMHAYTYIYIYIYTRITKLVESDKLYDVDLRLPILHDEPPA